MGYIIIDRSIVDWRWYTERGMRHLFEHLILTANFKDGMWHGINVKRGQLITTRCRLSRETGLTEKEVRTGLERLQRTGEIIIKATNQYSLITICNYDTYQGQDNRRSQSKANESPTKVQGEATIEKGEEVNNSESSLCSDSSSVHAPTISECKIDHQAFMVFFNHEMADKAIPKITQMNKLRKGMLNARVKEHGKEAVSIVVRKAAASTWLNGGDGKFVASFDWLFKPNNFIKVYEGNYDDHYANSLPASNQASSKSVSTNSNTSVISSTNNTFKFSSYEQHRKDEQQKRLEGYSEAVNEILERR